MGFFQFKTKIMVVKCLVDTDVTIKDDIYEEYCDNEGFFYRRDPKVKPIGLGLPFTAFKERDWLATGRVQLIGEIPAQDSQWWPMLKLRLELEMESLEEQRKNIQYLLDVNNHKVKQILEFKQNILE